MNDSRRPKLAFFSPLNPVRSGISDYSEEILPYLAESADVDVVVDGYQPTSPRLADHCGVLDAREFSARKSEYDWVVYQVGNNYAHCGYMIPLMAEAPGVAVIHDYSLSYLMLGLTAMRGDVASLEKILEASEPNGGGRSVRDLLLSRADPYEVSLAAPVVEMARGIIVHNRFSETRLRSAYPEKRIRVIPHPTPIRELPRDRAGLRAKLGFAPDDLILASVSSVAYNKRLGLMIDAAAALLPRRPRLKLLIVGQGALGGELRRAIARQGLTDRVILTGWVDAERYLECIDAADIVADLRYPTAGETSGSILRAMQAGKPLIVSDHGFFAELGDDYARKIPVGEGEGRRFAEVLDELLGDEPLRARLGAAARRFAAEHLRREDAARRYLDFLAEAAAGDDPVRRWDLPAAAGRSWKAKFLAGVYKIGRLGYYRRRYGLRDTLRRAAAG